MQRQAVCDAPRGTRYSCVCVCASSDAPIDKDNAKVGLFIAASVGTFALMAAMYCIYNKFYTKQQYLHTQLNDDSGKRTGLCKTVNGFQGASSLQGLSDGHDCACKNTQI